MVASEEEHNALKRRIRFMEDTGDSSEHSPIHRLTDELLVEILHRLPCSKSATQCKTVCKRWLALIGSDPLFLRSFLARRRQVAKDADLWLPFGFFSQYMTWDVKSRNGVHEFVSDDSAAFRASGFSLSFLPCEDPDKIWILASHNDLLVCCPNSFDHSVYYLCNPLTKHWLALPPPPSHQRSRVSNITGRIRVGFVCEPYYDNPTVINRGYKFKLVCIPPLLGMVQFEVEIFSSNTCQWSTSIFKLPPLCNLKSYLINTVAYNGMLHWVWVDGIKGHIDIIGLNPTEGEHEQQHDMTCHFISGPSGSPRGILGCFGVCKGCLRVSLLQTRRDVISENDVPSFSIWELKDYLSGEWTLLHELHFNQLCSNDPLLSKYANFNGPVAPITALAFHPYDEEVIYFLFPKFVASCNLRTRKLQVAGKVPPGGLMYHGVFPLVLPYWPTPLPILENISN